MKTRQSLVSNSSTTSFCIYGICLGEGFRNNTEEIFNSLKRFQKSFPDEYNKCVSAELENLLKYKEDKDYLIDIACHKLLLDIKNKEFEDYKTFYTEETEDENNEMLYELFYELSKSINLKIYSRYIDNSSWIGRPFYSIRDDETGKQFKESTKIVIDKLSFNDEKCGIIEEAWRDG